MKMCWPGLKAMGARDWAIEMVGTGRGRMSAVGLGLSFGLMIVRVPLLEGFVV